MIKNTTNVPTPLFEESTAYRPLLTYRRDYVDNTITAFFVYMVRDKCVVNAYDNETGTLGFEKYHFKNADLCNDYYKLLDALYDYTIFLGQEYPDNRLLFDFEPLARAIRAFNAKYDDAHQEKTKLQGTQTWWQQLQTRREQRATNRLFNHIETRDIQMIPFDGYNPMVVQKYSNDLIYMPDCVPVFKTIVIPKQEPEQNYYVYQIKLIQSVDDDEPDMYSQRPCIHISLFKNEQDANGYADYYKSESKKFQQQPGYQKLVKECYPALLRWYKYMHAQTQSAKADVVR